MKLYELQPVHATQKSFYRKAMVQENEGTLVLTSYETVVAKIENGIATVFSLDSNTTVRHIKEFLLQNGFKAEKKSQIEKDYLS